MQKIFLFLIFGVLTFTIGFYSHNIFNSFESDKTENRLPENYKFINPLLECNTNSISRDTNLDNLKNKLKQQFSESTSIYYRDMNNGPWFGINEKELFSPASLVKVPLMMAYLKKAQSNPQLLDQEILNTTIYDPKTQNFQPKVTLAPNQKYTVKQLIEQMIIYSDDVSYNLLSQQLSADEIVKTYTDLGVDISKVLNDPFGNIISVKAYASFFRILFNASYLNREMSEYALKLLSQSDFKDGLIVNLPKNITVSHKFGERQYLDTGLKQLHDCGIIYVPNKPYLLCVMTRGDNFNTLKNTIKNVSQIVFQNISSLDN